MNLYDLDFDIKRAIYVLPSWNACASRRTFQSQFYGVQIIRRG